MTPTQLIGVYLRAIDMGQREAKQFLFANYRTLAKTLTVQGLRECILNYRTHFEFNNKSVILYKFHKYIISKPKKHTSDLAIAYNILKNCDLTFEEQKVIVEFLHSRAKVNSGTTLFHLPIFKDDGLFRLKKLALMNHVKDMQNIRRSLAKRPLL